MEFVLFTIDRGRINLETKEGNNLSKVLHSAGFLFDVKTRKYVAIIDNNIVENLKSTPFFKSIEKIIVEVSDPHTIEKEFIHLLG